MAWSSKLATAPPCAMPNEFRCRSSTLILRWDLPGAKAITFAPMSSLNGPISIVLGTSVSQAISFVIRPPSFILFPIENIIRNKSRPSKIVLGNLLTFRRRNARNCRGSDTSGSRFFSGKQAVQHIHPWREGGANQINLLPMKFGKAAKSFSFFVMDRVSRPGRDLE